jgi:hypothetical protein
MGMHEKNPPERMFRGIKIKLLSDVGQQSDLTSALDSGGQVTLVSGAGTGGTAGQNLAALGQVTAELAGVLVIDAGHLIHAKCANLSALAGANTLFVSHGHFLLVRL